ncbi:MAG: hypothetical protein AAFP03_14485 [Cyanobacteria bacterium J06598_3]
MAKKSKGFGELLKQQKRNNKGQQALTKFGQDFASSPLAEKIDGIVTNPPGAAKMSDVLDDFVEPYGHDEMTLSERKNLLGLAMVAWNLAILPKAERQKMMAQFFAESLKVDDPSVQREMESLIKAMITRKLDRFAENKRHILNYQLEDLGDEFHLSVASTLPA